ncbi:PIN domain-containing protein [Rhodanobacter sp. DHB23]|uniref:PIN domain-containing protein n=1 Tax=Rhodanobacter sp. DHB23 TaxID=2775923 RepID=UPI001785EF0F|nr:PIN domain-containing protein [Rhodanobacter sp. DHB23]MBD8873364.1 PIN domain-containing protein [Rhodanobacter sp. DHB23]
MPPPRLVLDTNVCLDLFVFGDAQCMALREALRAGTVEAATDAACRDEWLEVLGYPQLALDAARRDAAAAAFDAHLRLLPEAERQPVPALPGLPRCADPDDQMFLELAQACGAQWLLSRDKELLKLARRTRRDHGFDIVTPQDWSGAYAGLAGASSAKPV